MLTMELLDSVPMLCNLSAPAKCKLHMMNTVGVEDGERSGTSLGVRTPISGVVAKLKDVTGFSERRPLKIQAVPPLFLNDALV